MKQTRASTKKTFQGSIVKTKHRGLTSLTFMQLVPGAYRVVRHICIRCIPRLVASQFPRPTETDDPNAGPCNCL